jgi:uracil-DNA glycosylase
LSAAAGFFGSRPFSRANDLLVRAGGEPVNWTLEQSPDFAAPALANGPT